tara:strand:+ start:434 stop:3421 length:2988 start_codon:yes stop_codon:yes gene_type:complete
MRQYFFFFILTVFFFNNIDAKENKSLSKYRGCTYSITNENLKNIDNIPIKLIEVDTHDYRKWTVNSVRILINRFRFVDERYKKRHDATITINYVDGSKCIFEGRVRHSGDEKDHIAQLNNSISQSIDVHLKNGNIRGITKFKLLRSNTRGNLEDEIFLTEILRNLNFIAPRTVKVEARVNKVITTMIFQEKAAKEMLEFHNRREGPILEGDERFFRKLVEKFEDNNLSNWSVGMVPLMNKSSKYMLSKQVNANIVQKSAGHAQMSLNASAYLNFVYLYFANRFQDNENDYNYFEYDLDNTLLGLFDKKKISLLNEYNLIMQSTNSNHGLAINNRKFYWNSLENYFEPINYDSNPNISKNINLGQIRLPNLKNYLTSIQSIENKLRRIDLDDLQLNLSVSGLQLSKKTVKGKIEKIITNLYQIKYNYENYLTDDVIDHNKFVEINNILNVFNTNIKNSHPNTFLISQNEKENNFQKCEIFLENCQKVNYSSKDISDLLEGEFDNKNHFFQYIGKASNSKKLLNQENYKKINFQDSIIFYEEGININISEDNKEINIEQIISGAKVYITGGFLENIKLNFKGFVPGNNIIKEIKPKNYPSDYKGLTGCLSLINIKVKDLELKSYNSTCEDSINFINASGDVKNIYIANAFSDALDVDFSNLKIQEIEVKSALNDCVDFSSGNYELLRLKLTNCGDKALSIGEKSFIDINNINASYANIGIASKDSSIVSAEKAIFQNVKTCLSAYNKKQEYNGGFLNITSINCKDYFVKADLDVYSKIIVGGNNLKNYEYGKSFNPNNFKIREIEDQYIFENLIKDHKTFNNDNSINAVVEISKGMNEKWEVSKKTGSLNREFYMGLPRKIEYSSYPVNYGLIPMTVLPTSRGGDGDALDVIILGDTLIQGKVVKVKILGLIKMIDSGEQDDKVIAVPVNGDLSKYENLNDFSSDYPETLNNISEWFEKYKGKNLVEFQSLGSKTEAIKLIKDSNRYFKKFGIRPRG